MKLVLQNPVKDILITQFFGNPSPVYTNLGLLGHNGLDIRASDGTPVYATHDGRVTFAGYDGAGGLLVVIRTEQMFEYKDTQSFFKTIYGHLKKDTLKVTGGQTVKAGQQIAEADNTGLSTGSHLHFGLKPIYQGEQDWEWYNLTQNEGYNGAIDPLPYMPEFQPFKREMRKSSVFNDDVVVLQAFFLRTKRMNPLTFNEFGYYGKKTAEAVLSFQLEFLKLSWYERYVLAGSVVGPKTLYQLNVQYKDNT